MYLVNVPITLLLPVACVIRCHFQNTTSSSWTFSSIRIYYRYFQTAFISDIHIIIKFKLLWNCVFLWAFYFIVLWKNDRSIEQYFSWTVIPI